MTVTLSARPQKHKRGPPSRSPAPWCDLPADVPLPTSPTNHGPLADDDHVAAISDSLRRITELDTLMTKLETRIDRITDKLADPDLLTEIPASDRRRLEAEDLCDELRVQWTDARWELSHEVAVIATHGHYLVGDGDVDVIDSVGRQLRHDHGALGRVQADVPAVLTTDAWQRLCAAAVPF